MKLMTMVGDDDNDDSDDGDHGGGDGDVKSGLW